MDNDEHSTGKDVENWVIFVAAGNVKRGGHFRGFYCFLKNLNAKLPQDPTIPHVSLSPREIKKNIPTQNLYMNHRLYL